jgi:hypothetical protein
MERHVFAAPASPSSPDSKASRHADEPRSFPTLGQFLVAIGGILLVSLAFGLLARLVSACVM